MGMSAKMMMFVYFTFIIGSIVCLMLEGGWLDSDDQQTINDVLGFDVADISFWGIPKVMAGFFSTGLPNLILWDYSFFYGTFEILRYTLCFAISAGVVWGVTTTFASFAFGIATKVLGW